MSLKNIDIICVGEILIDRIGNEMATSLAETKSFSNHLGGSPSNVAQNMALLGFNTALVASIGDDNLGHFILGELEKTALKLDNINLNKDKKTSYIKILRTTGTPEFMAYRQADMCIEPKQISSTLLSQSKIFHTTCFALSKNPAQTTILQKAEEAFKLGCQLSIDLNYAQEIWEDTEVLPIIKSYCKYQPIVKLSDDDAFRIFKKKLSDKEIFDYLSDLGAQLVCLTKGKEGAYVFKKGEEIFFQKAPKIDKVVDVTGAGDAFWSGFLAGYLKKRPIKDCLKIANKLVALKMQHVGGLPHNISINY